VVSLTDQGKLTFSPAEEVKALRRRHSRYAYPPSGPLDGVSGGALEIVAELEPADSGHSGIKVLASPDGREETVVAYDFAAESLRIDTTRSSMSESVVKEVKSAPAEGSITLRIFVDRSVVEAFAGGTCLTARVYPELPDSTRIGVFSEGGPCHVQSLDVWEMEEGMANG
jgi:beta-fructofuranosidase